MKIQYFGTAAYERIPALFCNCGVCKLAREKGGKNIRTQTQTIIDDKILIDFNMDNYIHAVTHKVDFSALECLLVTHGHEDHFIAEELSMRGSYFGHDLTKAEWQIIGSSDIENRFLQNKRAIGTTFKVIKPYETVKFDKYTITALPATHVVAEPLCYIISDGEKTVFYSLDTGLMKQEVYDFIKDKKFKFDLVICDCTCGLWDSRNCGGHMSLLDNDTHRSILKECGAVCENTKWVINHFSHNALFKNGKPTDAEILEEEAGKLGMEVAFDGKIDNI